MKWEQRELGLALPGVISAVVTDVSHGWAARVFRPKEDQIFTTEQEAKEWAEARMNEIKKEFILSLITKDGHDYKFGNILNIYGRYEGVDEWTVYGAEDKELFEGTLEECKNYIASCF